MTVDEKNRIRVRIEDVLSSILSDKYNAKIKIQFKQIDSEKDDEKENNTPPK